MEYKKLNNIAKLVGGFAFKSSNYVDKGLRVIRIANVQDGYISDESPCFYPMDMTKQIGDALLESEDLLMSLTGNVGRVAFINKELLPAGLNQRVECIRPYDPELKHYLYYFFLSNRFKSDAEKNASGSAQLNMSTVWLGNYPIPLHSKEKRKEIVLILSNLKSAIKDSEAQLQLLDELVKSRFIEMFGSIKKTDLLENLTTKITDGSHLPPKGIEHSNYLMLSSQNIHDEILLDDVRFLSKEDFEKENKRTDIQEGDVLLTIVGTIGRTHVVTNDEKYVFQRSVGVLKPKRNVLNGAFLASFLKTPEAVEQLESGGHGTSQKGIYLADLKKLKIPLVDYNEQIKYAEFVRLIDKSKFIVQKRIKFLTVLYDEKMEEYFGGNN